MIENRPLKRGVVMVGECYFFEELFVEATNLLTNSCVGDLLLAVFLCYVRSVIFLKRVSILSWNLQCSFPLVFYLCGCLVGA